MRARRNLPQLADRGFWQEVADNGGSIRYPGGFAVVDGRRLAIRRPAPSIGEHNDEVYGHLGSVKSEVARRTP